MTALPQLEVAKRQNKQVIANSGVMQGQRATIVSTTVVPDGQPNQRKILIQWEDGTQDYILPRQLDVVQELISIGGFQSSIPVLSGQGIPATVGASTFTQEQIEAVQEMRPLPDHPDHPFYDRYRPSDSVLKQYKNRENVFGSELNDIDYLLWWWGQRENGHSVPVALSGDTQAGKTMLFRRLCFAIAQSLGLEKPVPLFTLMGSNAITDHDLFGTVRTDPNTGRPVFMRGIVQLAVEAPVCLLNLDEPNAMAGSTQSSLFSVLDDRKSFTNLRLPVQTEFGYLPAVTSVSKGCWVVASWNPAYSGMNKVNEAFRARFKMIKWGYDTNLEDAILKSPTLRILADALRNLRDKRVITTPIGMTDLLRLKSEAEKFGSVVAIKSFLGTFQSTAEEAAVESALTDNSVPQMFLNEVGK
jgi:MoxR-like ATPase